MWSTTRCDPVLSCSHYAVLSCAASHASEAIGKSVVERVRELLRTSAHVRRGLFESSMDWFPHLFMHGSMSVRDAAIILGLELVVEDELAMEDRASEERAAAAAAASAAPAAPLPLHTLITKFARRTSRARQMLKRMLDLFGRETTKYDLYNTAYFSGHATHDSPNVPSHFRMAQFIHFIVILTKSAGANGLVLPIGDDQKSLSPLTAPTAISPAAALLITGGAIVVPTSIAEAAKAGITISDADFLQNSELVGDYYADFLKWFGQAKVLPWDLNRVRIIELLLCSLRSPLNWTRCYGEKEYVYWILAIPVMRSALLPRYIVKRDLLLLVLCRMSRFITGHAPIVLQHGESIAFHEGVTADWLDFIAQLIIKDESKVFTICKSSACCVGSFSLSD